VTDPYTPERRAEGKIGLGIARLAGDYPFHAVVLERLQVRPRSEVGTMGVTVSGDLVLLYYNPEFVLDISIGELEGVLLHEVHHIVLGHVLADPADYPDTWARIVAEEVSANEFVTLPLPGNPITLDLFPALPPLESTRRRYDRLKGARKRSLILVRDTARDAHDLGVGADGEGLAIGGGRGGALKPTRDGSRPIAPHGAAREVHRVPREGSSRTGTAQPEPIGPTLDDHSVWTEARGDLDWSLEVVRELVREALLQVGPDRPLDHLKSALTGLGIGRATAEGRYGLQGRGLGHLDWRRQLRRHAGRVLEERPVFNRPPRRFPDLVGILPGRRRRPARPRVMAVIDTSGSMSVSLLEQVNAELTRLARQSTVFVVECDAAVRRVYPHRKPGSFSGRGGTDFRPPLEPAFQRRHRPDLIIYFTDGFGPAPETPPRSPVIWCLTPGGRPPAIWGRVIRMDDRDGGGSGGHPGGACS